MVTSIRPRMPADAMDTRPWRARLPYAASVSAAPVAPMPTAARSAP